MNEDAYRAILRRLGVELVTAGAPELPAGSMNADPIPPVGVPPLAERVRCFRAQVEEWIASGRLGVPVLTLPGVEAVRRPDMHGCLSCATPIPADRLRCDPCRQAVTLALGLPPVENG